ncbi:MAG TPA: hypothetical protein VMV69_02900 [Pirellulales bacterium]|nr:hypothetical protein [Pirellulales bacterium]
MKLAALIVPLFLFGVLPAQAGSRGTPTRAVSVPSHSMQPGMPGGGQPYRSPRVAGVYSARPGHYSSNERYSGGRAVYAAYTSAGYGPYGGRGGYGGFGGGYGGFGGGYGGFGGYNIEMQRLLEHQFELRAIGQYLPIHTVAPEVSYNPDFVPRASQLAPDEAVYPAPQPLTVTNPFYRPTVARQASP